MAKVAFWERPEPRGKKRRCCVICLVFGFGKRAEIDKR
jgi:hypothetical protein